MSLDEITRFKDEEMLARGAAERFVAAAEEALRRSGRFTVVLAGGATPEPAYRLLASPRYRRQVSWTRSMLLFGDERCVPPDDEQSNFRMARAALIEHVDVPPNRVYRIEGEREPAEAAERYEMILRDLFIDEEAPHFDLLLLGMGADGHTASLFPGTEALEEKERWVVANRVSEQNGWRITLTYPALCAAHRIIFLITGAEKARTVAEAFGGLEHDTPYPCERVIPVDGTREVLLDAAAAAALP
jgi:6-phosphogluconolactonase